ncbi:unnamed protein product [Paramecium pentaurelia]|uniref:Uncharacterized protein n=1 Tax=Paramecium pentaurelia TaxID=43138 RepID=A0A8S1SYY6_9CILI|nr:unnamed protein product [Paramecium pentaurelia]
MSVYSDILFKILKGIITSRQRVQGFQKNFRYLPTKKDILSDHCNQLIEIFQFQQLCFVYKNNSRLKKTFTSSINILMRHKNQFQLKNGKTQSIYSTESTIQTPSRQLSPKSPQIWTSSALSYSNLPIQSDAQYQAKIKELLEENQKLIQKSSVQDLIINKLQQIEEQEPIRSSRVNTLNNVRNNDRKQIIKIQKPIYTREAESKDDKMLFTFFSPEPNQKTSVCKLPKVFQVVPKKRKYFI